MAVLISMARVLSIMDSGELVSRLGVGIGGLMLGAGKSRESRCMSRGVDVSRGGQAYCKGNDFVSKFESLVFYNAGISMDAFEFSSLATGCDLSVNDLQGQ